MPPTQATHKGRLYIVATPSGNREDISFRALNVLKTVDLIVAEDTRHSAPLLQTLGIQTRLQSLHAHNEKEKSKQLLEPLLKGQFIALISDAGTPLISDPGYPLVKLAREQGIDVIPIPGACALISALCAAGIPCDTFLFLGFLPAKQQARQTQLQQFKNSPHTLIFYESTHRIMDCLKDMAVIFGDQCEMVLAKELTKTFERFVQGTVTEVQHWLKEDPYHIKGEFVLLLPPQPVEEQQAEQERVLSILLPKLPLKQAVLLASQITQGPKNELYDLALKLKETL